MHAFILLLSITVLINAAVYAFMEPILLFLHVPDAVRGGMREYLAIIYVGLIATSLYNYVSCLLRAWQFFRAADFPCDIRRAEHCA